MRYIQYFKDMMYITGEKTSTIVWYFIFFMAEEGAQLLPPIALAGIIGVLTNGGGVNEILVWALLFLVFQGMYFLSRAIVWEMYARIGKKMHMLLQQKIFEHVVNNDGIFDDLSRGKILATCTDDIRWVVDVIDCSVGAVTKIIKLVIIFVVFASNNIWVAIVALLFVVIYMILMDKNARKYSKYFDGSRKYEDKAAEVFNQTISNVKQVKMMNLLPSMLRKYNNVAKKWAEQYIARRKYRRKLYVMDEWVIYVGKITLYVMMGVFVLNGKMQLEMLVLLVSYFDQMITSSNELWRDCLRALSEYGVQTGRVKRILNYTQKSEVEFGDFDNDYISGLVEFKNVSLNRNGEKALKKVSFKARPNEITAIIGPSGAGKTSIANLLYRIDKVSSGNILIDDENIYNYSKKVHNSNVSGVFQNPFVLNMSIRDNLGVVDRNHKRQEEVMERLGLAKMIKKLPQGYDTIVKEGEDVLSEGDKQLLSVARAILTKAEILVFDELSTIGAQAIPNLTDILEDLKQDHTIILITHDKDLIRKADRVIEMKDGRVVKTLRRKKTKQTISKTSRKDGKKHNR